MKRRCCAAGVCLCLGADAAVPLPHSLKLQQPINFCIDNEHDKVTGCCLATLPAEMPCDRKYTLQCTMTGVGVCPPPPPKLHHALSHTDSIKNMST